MRSHAVQRQSSEEQRGRRETFLDNPTQAISSTSDTSSLTPNQRSILNMQQTAGNAAVRNKIQRDPPNTPNLLSMRTPPSDAPLAPPGSAAPRPNIFAPLTYSQMQAILGPPAPGAGTSAAGPRAGSSDPAVESQITVRFDARRRVAGSGGPADRTTLTTETETTGHVAPGVDVTHTGSDEGHQFAISIEGRVGGRAAPELSAEGSVQLDPTGTTVSNIQVNGRAQWTREYLNHMLRIQPFVRLLVQAERPESSGSVTASAPVSLAPGATVSTGANARLRIGSTTITLAGSIAVEIPSHEVTTTLSAEISQRLAGPLSVDLRGERRDTFGVGDPTGRTTGTAGLTIGDRDGTHLRISGGVESTNGQTGLTGGAMLEGHF